MRTWIATVRATPHIRIVSDLSDILVRGSSTAIEEGGLGAGRYELRFEGATEDEARDAATQRLAPYDNVKIESVDPV